MQYYDAIVIHFTDGNNYGHNIIVDGGEISRPKFCYFDRLKGKLEDIFSKGESIDLWVITHIDNDHIGGLYNFINDKDFFEQHHERLKEVWMNYGGSDDYYVQREGTIGYESGKELRSVIQEHSICVRKRIVAGFSKTISDLEITVVAPDIDTYNSYIEWWNSKEFKEKVETSEGLVSGGDWDYDVMFKDFDLEKYDEDKDIKNNSSIAFVLSYHNHQILFPADSCSSILLGGLGNTKKLKGERIKLDLVHIPHHGSCRNSSFKFFEQIDCRQYVITGNGENRFRLPDKETIARLIAANTMGCSIHFTNWNGKLQEIFSSDEDPRLTVSNEVRFLFE